MSREAFLTPISQVHNESDRIRVAIPFPEWVQTRGIGMDVKRTERLMNWGGISTLRLVGETEGQRTTVMPISVGSTRDGSRFAGMGAAKESTKMQSIQNRLDRHHRSSFRNAEWTSTQITLNLQEMQRKIDEHKGDLRKPEPWTPLIDNSLRWGIRKAGSEHLLTNFTGYQKFMNFFVNIHSNLLSSANLSILDLISHTHPHVPTIELLVFSTALNFSVWSTIESIIYGLDIGDGNGYRLSLLPGYEIDRAAMLHVLSRTNKLVKPIK